MLVVIIGLNLIPVFLLSQMTIPNPTSDLDSMRHPVLDRITGATPTRSPPSASASTEADEGGTSIYNNNNIAEDCGTPIYNNSCLEATSVSYRAAEKSRLPKRR